MKEALAEFGDLKIGGGLLIRSRRTTRYGQQIGWHWK
jgi:hypothetical protein